MEKTPKNIYMFFHILLANKWEEFCCTVKIYIVVVSNYQSVFLELLKFHS